jgi:predicted site-specific integrase-resolvase
MKKLGVSIVTLRTWASNGLIETIRSGGNHRLYNVDKYLKDCIKQNTIQKDIEHVDTVNKKKKSVSNIKYIDNNSDSDSDTDIEEYYNKKSNMNNKKENICYIRVCSSYEIEYLNKQKKYMNKYYPNHRIIEDIGSSINLNRKGFQEILDLVLNNQLDTLVIMNKNILCSMAYDLIDNLFSKCNSKIIIETNKYKNTNDIMYDIQDIINFYKNINDDINGGDNNSTVKIDLLSDVSYDVHLGLKSSKSLVKTDSTNFKQGVKQGVI